MFGVDVDKKFGIVLGIVIVVVKDLGIYVGVKVKVEFEVYLVLVMVGMILLYDELGVFFRCLGVGLIWLMIFGL